MQTKADHPIHSLKGKQIQPIIKSYFEICALKQLYRQGWLKRGVPKARCESVAEHSFGVAILALWLAEAYYPELDSDKLLRMALLHDFGEIYAGDIIPSDEVPTEEKSCRERQSVELVLGDLAGGDLFIELWEEFEQGDSAEAHLIRQVDRLEMGLQAGVYMSQGFTGLDEFILSSQQALSDDELLRLLSDLEKELAMPAPGDQNT